MTTRGKCRRGGPMTLTVINTRILLEVAVASAADAENVAARRAGLPIVTVLRPRPSGFCHSETELSVMLRDLEWIDGEVAVGILTAACEIDVQRLRRLPTPRIVF